MATKKPEHSSGLIKALKFVELSGSEHCFIGSNQITAYTDSIALGHPIEEDLNAIAHIKFLKNALLKSPNQTKITQLELAKLQVDTGEFTVYVNAEAAYVHACPDAFAGSLGGVLGEGFRVLAPLLTIGEKSETPIFSSILMRSGSIFASNRRVLAEFWHGFSTPELNIPKDLIKLIVKSKLEIVGFGFSENSVTFYFKNGSWAMGRLVKGNWIEPNQFFDSESKHVDIPSELVKGISAVRPFISEGNIYFNETSVCSHKSYDGAKFNLSFPHSNARFNFKDIEWIISNFTQFDCSGLDKWSFFGNNIRAVIASMGD